MPVRPKILQVETKLPACPAAVHPRLGRVPLACVAEVDEVARRSDVKKGAVLGEFEEVLVLFELTAERVGRPDVRDVQLRAVPVTDDHHLPAVKRSLPDLRLKLD